jgi:hypothetical protein
MDQNRFAEFEGFVNEPSRRTEKECGTYLSDAANLLMPKTPISFQISREERNYFGRSDLIVSATFKDEVLSTNFESAYIWELKAPQCHLFEFDDSKNRCIPSEDLLRAENQLLHYLHEARNNRNFWKLMNITGDENIKLGGIIIGTKQNFLKGASGSLDIAKATMCLDIRKQYFYGDRLRVMTWDNVLDFVRP